MGSTIEDPVTIMMSPRESLRRFARYPPTRVDAGLRASRSVLRVNRYRARSVRQDCRTG